MCPFYDLTYLSKYFGSAIDVFFVLLNYLNIFFVFSLKYGEWDIFILMTHTHTHIYFRMQKQIFLIHLYTCIHSTLHTHSSLNFWNPNVSCYLHLNFYNVFIGCFKTKICLLLCSFASIGIQRRTCVHAYKNNNVWKYASINKTPCV